MNNYFDPKVRKQWDKAIRRVTKEAEVKEQEQKRILAKLEKDKKKSKNK